jgi:glycosyltransferase involved in cell wall biosynthesis
MTIPTEYGKITVVTVVKNAVEALAETIRSVAGHLGPGVEYIIVDGASTDGTLEVIRRHEPLLKGWRSAPDKGVYDAMNRGWELADPQSRVLYLGAGDRLISLPDPAETVLPAETIVYGNVSFANGAVFYARADFRLRLYNTLHHQALLIPKRLHPDPPFDLAYPLYADFDFNQRLFKQDADFRFSPELLAYAAPDGLTRELDIEELTAVTRKNFGQRWSGLARIGFGLARHCPPIRRLRPIR